MKRKVCVVITARPSYSRIKTALEAIRAHDELELSIVAAASALIQKYGTVANTIRSDGFAIDECVYNLIEGETFVTSAKTTGLGVIEMASVFERHKPDVVVTIADRFETMSTAIAAAYMNIPLAHIQGGEVTGNIDEKVRHAITKLADLHLVATKKAAERVIKMGENPDTVFVTGCPSIDIAKQITEKSNKEKYDPTAKYSGVGRLLQDREHYIVVMQHPVTTEPGQEAGQIRQTYEAVKDLPQQIYWFWPNVDAGADLISREIRRIREKDNPGNIYFFKGLNAEDFILLLDGADCIVGNSSVAIREASYLGTPAINIGSRQNGRERGKNVVDVDYNKEDIRNVILLNSGKKFEADNNYGHGQAGISIAKVLAEAELTFDKRLQY